MDILKTINHEVEIFQNNTKNIKEKKIGILDVISTLVALFSSIKYSFFFNIYFLLTKF